MEAYKSSCPDCGAVYYWQGYKTGFGKSKTQLEQMHRDETVCKKCGSQHLKTELDRESDLGQVYAEMDGQAAEMISNMLGGKKPDAGSAKPS